MFVIVYKTLTAPAHQPNPAATADHAQRNVAECQEREMQVAKNLSTCKWLNLRLLQRLAIDISLGHNRNLIQGPVCQTFLGSSLLTRVYSPNVQDTSSLCFLILVSYPILTCCCFSPSASLGLQESAPHAVHCYYLLGNLSF